MLTRFPFSADMDMDMEDEEDTEVGDNVNNVLFIENIPGEITDTELKSLFSKYVFLVLECTCDTSFCNIL